MMIVRTVFLTLALVASGCARKATVRRVRPTLDPAPADGRSAALDCNPAAPEPSAWDCLLSVAGEDLRGLAPETDEAARSAIREVLSRESDPDCAWDELTPWYLWKLGDNGRGARFVLLEVQDELVTCPGTTAVGVHVLDAGGGRLSSTYFDVGYRSYASEARLDCDSLPGEALIELRIEVGLPEGEWGSSQFYAFLDDGPALIRHEWRDHTSVGVRFYGSRSSAGPSAPERTAEEWETMLVSEDAAQVLHALVWLGGVRMPDEVKPRDRDDARALRDAGTFEALRGRASVRELVGRMATDPTHVWIGEAAAVAAKRLAMAAAP